MVGRNEPCPCGSGKKYKACCLKIQNIVNVELPIKNELQDCMDRYVEKGKPLNDIRKMNQWTAEQEVKLSKVYSAMDAKYIYADAYAFMYHPDVWQQHINLEIKKTIRPTVKTILEKWRKPKYMLLQIDEDRGDHYVAKDVLTGETIEVEKDNKLIVEREDYLFCPFLNSSSESTISYFSINVMVISPSLASSEAIWWVKSAYAKGQWKTTEEFYYENLLVCYEALGKKDWSTRIELSEKELTLVQTIKNELITLDLDFTKIIPVVEKFLQVKGYPKRMQKYQGFVAGAIFLGDYVGFYELGVQRKQLAAYFGVSTTTTNKYENLLLDFYEVHRDELRKPIMAYVQGTDPRPSEFEQWKMMIQMEKKPLDFSSGQDLNKELNKLQNEPFIPETDKELAQVLAYRSYLAEGTYEKMTYADKAWGVDSQNPDALLLRATAIKDVLEQRKYIKQAIHFGEKQADFSVENPWALMLNRPYMRALLVYGVSYFEERNYEEAIKPFERLLELNPIDHQGVRYLAITCYIALGELNKAEKLFINCRDEQDAMIMWLKWAWLKQVEGNTQKVEKAKQQAIDLNPFAEKYMLLKMPPMKYPGSLTTVHQSPEEGQMTWYLLRHIVE